MIEFLRDLPLSIPQQPWGRYVIVSAGVYQCIFAGAAIFGWNAIETGLRQAGVFADACGEGSPVDVECDERSLAYSGVYISGTTTTFSILMLFGPFSDAVGPSWSARVGTFMFVLALLFAAFAVLFKVDELVYATSVFLGMSSPGFLLSPMSAGALFPQTSGTVMAAINGAFDSSAIVFVIVGALVSAGLSYPNAIFVYLAFPTSLIVLFSIFLWPHRVYTPLDRPESSRPASSGGEVELSELEDGETRGASVSSVDVRDRHAVPARYEHLSIREQILTSEFLAYTAFGAVSLFKFSFYLGTLRLQLLWLADGDVGATEFWLQVFSIIFPVGAVSVFAAGPIIDRWGLEAGFCVKIGLSLAFSIVTMIPILPLQVLSFLFLVMFRALLFTVQANFFALRFGFKSFGRLLAIPTLVGGLLGTLQFPVVDAVLRYADGSFLIPNLVILALTVGQIGFLVYFHRIITTEKQLQTS